MLGFLGLVAADWPEYIREVMRGKFAQLEDQRVVRLYRILSELLESGAGDDDPRLEEAADIMAAGLEEACASGEPYPDKVVHDDLPFRLLEALAVETAPGTQRMMDLMRERGWNGWIRLERLAEPPG